MTAFSWLDIMKAYVEMPMKVTVSPASASRILRIMLVVFIFLLSVLVGTVISAIFLQAIEL